MRPRLLPFVAMSGNPKHNGPYGPEPHRPLLCCDECGTDSHLFISSVFAPALHSDQSVKIFYTCTKCGRSYRQLAEPSQFAGILSFNAVSQDVVVLDGHYIHCGQSMQRTASGFVMLDGRLIGEESAKSRDVYLDIRIMECPCGFRLVLPD